MLISAVAGNFISTKGDGYKSNKAKCQKEIEWIKEVIYLQGHKFDANPRINSCEYSREVSFTRIQLDSRFKLTNTIMTTHEVHSLTQFVSLAVS